MNALDKLLKELEVQVKKGTVEFKRGGSTDWVLCRGDRRIDILLTSPGGYRMIVDKINTLFRDHDLKNLVVAILEDNKRREKKRQEQEKQERQEKAERERAILMKKADDWLHILFEDEIPF